MLKNWSSHADGVIRSNNREDQRKRIKYNHLVANTIIFYNVYHMSEILHGNIN